MQDHTEGSSMHSQALETLRERLREAELALRREQDGYRQMQVHTALCQLLVLIIKSILYLSKLHSSFFIP